MMTSDKQILDFLKEKDNYNAIYVLPKRPLNAKTRLIIYEDVYKEYSEAVATGDKGELFGLCHFFSLSVYKNSVAQRRHKRNNQIWSMYASQLVLLPEWGNYYYNRATMINRLKNPFGDHLWDVFETIQRKLVLKRLIREIKVRIEVGR